MCITKTKQQKKALNGNKELKSYAWNKVVIKERPAANYLGKWDEANG